MSPSHEIKWVCVSDKERLCGRILPVGGINPVGYPWKLSQEEAIKGIEEGRWSFYIVKKDISTKIVVAKNNQGHKYLKTGMDTEQTNILLMLPEIPSSFQDQ